MVWIEKLSIRIIQIIIVSIAVLLLSSCESLPEGEPPEGPIVTIENRADQLMPLKAAINHMITALATSTELTAGKDKALPNIIPEPAVIPEKYRTQLTMLSINVYSELLTMGILDTDPTKPADYILSSTFVKLVKPSSGVKGKTAFRWEMSLIKPGASKPSWTYFLKIFLE